MLLNADFAQRAVVHAADEPWSASPMRGVERHMLDRIGGEVARATSIVRYAPGSHFSPHKHDGGEEFLVIEGVFQDEHGDYPVGTYVRNPPGTRHTPGSDAGCTILVKLRQFDPADDKQFSLNTNGLAFTPVADRPGVDVIALHADDRETVRLERWQASARVDYETRGGLEVFVIDGGFEEGGETFSRWSWLRLPAGAALSSVAGSNGCRLWVKEGHLAHVQTVSEV